MKLYSATTLLIQCFIYNIYESIWTQVQFCASEGISPELFWSVGRPDVPPMGRGGLQWRMLESAAPCRVCLCCPRIIWLLQSAGDCSKLQTWRRYFVNPDWLTSPPTTLSTGTEHPGDQSCNNMCKLLPTWNWGRGHIQRIISTVSSKIMSIHSP